MCQADTTKYSQPYLDEQPRLALDIRIGRRARRLRYTIESISVAERKVAVRFEKVNPESTNETSALYDMPIRDRI